ncbi:IS21 family transposase [Aquimarina sp. 2201CG14-23]|uniref:IS21 family transposase n=1 Tax=Aquimarina mycalae TaxID=3040073 RepID=UPI002477E41F|nr:IS21 family transposase [Aquimarina sp. 2201CG14-23]MDH7448482.1 IS21 family transposase [Aquimarina sp. 2201CG14-23]
MANTILDMRKIKKLYRLYTQGVSKRKISKQLSISRNTVRKYIGILVKSKLTSEEIDSLNTEDLRLLLRIDETITTGHPYVFKLFPEMSKQLKKVGVTRFMLWENYYQNKKVFISYSRFCHLYRVWSRTQSPVMRFIHKAGDKMFVDFTGKKLQVIDPSTGVIKEMEVFIAILGASGYTYVEACGSQKREDFIGCMVNALHFFGGVPRAIVTDNLKSAVTKSSKYEPILNESLLAMATHYDTTILPTRTYRPRDKALVENAVKIMYIRVFAELNTQDFYTLGALNDAVLKLTAKHNTMNFQARDCSRLGLFTSLEQEELLPLPTEKYQLRDYLMGTVYKTSHIHINKDKHHYSVPYRYIGKKVRIIYTKDTVEIYYKQKRIAVHKRGIKRYGYTTDREHMPSTHRYVADWNPDTFLNWADGIGDHCKTLITLLLAKRQHPEQSYKSCAGVLGFSKKVGNERLDNACKRALDYERINYQSIKNILEKGLDYLQEDTNTESSIPKHNNIRGGDYYK